MKKIRLGVIGCGNMGGQHLPAFINLKDVLEVSCTCDIDIEKAERTAELLNAKHFVKDYKDMLDFVDAVLVVLPHKLHFECGKFFAENKKHILMEKPFCINEKECIELNKIAKENNVKMMVAYPVPFWEEVKKLYEYMNLGLIGEPFQMTIYTDHYVPPVGARGTWMTSRGIGGGELFSHGCHYVDLLLRFLGKPISGSHLGTNHGTPWMEREGTSHAVIKFESGALGYYTGTWGAKGTSNHTKFEIYGTKGTLTYSVIGKFPKQIVLLKNFDKEVSDDEKITVLWDKSKSSSKTDGEIEHFIDCIINDKEPITSAERSTQSLRVIWKLYEAELEGKIANLKGLGLDEYTDAKTCYYDCDNPSHNEGY